jgi:hypothetical protein
MRIKATPEQFINSVTGITAIAGASLLLARRFDLAALVFGALALGSFGVAWDRYSTKSGLALDIRAFRQKRLPDEDELEFIATHAPYAVLSLASYLAGRKWNQLKQIKEISDKT